MKGIVIDTNALISFVTDRHPSQQKCVSVQLRDAARLKVTIHCPQNVLTEFVHVLDKIYRQPAPVICRLIDDFIALPGVRVENELDYKQLFKFWPAIFPDYGDAIVATVTKLLHSVGVLTFDAKFIRQLSKVGLSAVAR